MLPRWPQGTGSDLLASVYALISGQVSALPGLVDGEGLRALEPDRVWPSLTQACLFPPLERRAHTTCESRVESLSPSQAPSKAYSWSVVGPLLPQKPLLQLACPTRV